MWDDIVTFLGDLWDDLLEFFTDVFIFLLDLFLSGIAFIIEQIPVPDFAANMDLNALIAPEITWMVTQVGLPTAMAIIGAAIVFRILRKIFTLGIW